MLIGIFNLITSSLFLVSCLHKLGTMLLKYLRTLLIPGLFLFTSCNSSVKNIFSKKTANEAYADKVEDSPAGKEWLAVSKNILNSPYTVELPYRQLGYFPVDKPRAFALQFTAKRGERINIDLVKKKNSSNIIYADLFKINGTDFSHLLAVDTSQTSFGFDSDETATYILRLQPELNRSADYDLSMAISPSLGFPVSGSKARAGSFWGDDRDGGQRSHEGVDIFAPKLTPAIATADGYVTKVNEGGLGGKTVWMRVKDRNLHLYYAHLDQQLVQDGQQVKKGDTLGLVGNTGNAKNTPPHLHFGIYTGNGAIDPWPFVNKTVKTPAPVAAKELNGLLQIKTKAKTDSLMVPLAVNNKGYLAETTGGQVAEVNFNVVKKLVIAPVKQAAVIIENKGINTERKKVIRS